MFELCKINFIPKIPKVIWYRCFFTYDGAMRLHSNKYRKSKMHLILHYGVPVVTLMITCLTGSCASLLPPSITGVLYYISLLWENNRIQNLKYSFYWMLIAFTTIAKSRNCIQTNVNQELSVCVLNWGWRCYLKPIQPGPQTSLVRRLLKFNLNSR